MILQGDCLHKLKELEDNSIDSIVTDPPYGLSFMGKRWDYDVPSIAVWRECLRVLKPGGHLLSFGGTRTYHRLAVNIEDAGFEIRDQIMWIYGSGFPKSHNIQKVFEKDYECQFLNNVNLAERISGHSLLELREEKTGFVLGNVVIQQGDVIKKLMVTGRAADSSDPTGTFLLESTEVINLSTDTLWNATSADSSNPQKKFITLTKLSTIIESRILSLLPKLNMLANTCGAGTALKPANEPIVVARKPLEAKLTVAANVLKYGTGALNIDASRIGTETIKQIQVDTKAWHGNSFGANPQKANKVVTETTGRWPANILFDEDAAAVLDLMSGQLSQCGSPKKTTHDAGMFGIGTPGRIYKEENRGASRFFYVAKASKRERGEGNIHPTVKPIKLMEYLIRLVTPTNGTVLDPFMGSGTTGVAAKNLKFKFIGIEREKEYAEIAEKRIEA